MPEDPQIQELRQQIMLLQAQGRDATTHLEGVTAWKGIAETDTIYLRTKTADAALGPWGITFDGDEVTCSDCVYMRGPVTLAPTVAALTLALEDAYIAAHIDLADGTAELVEGASIGAVTDAAPLDDDTTYKKLLYHVVKTGGVWAVTMDYRAAAQLGVRL
jgi:hypothetical protein